MQRVFLWNFGGAPLRIPFFVDEGLSASSIVVTAHSVDRSFSDEKAFDKIPVTDSHGPEEQVAAVFLEYGEPSMFAKTAYL